MAPVFLHAFICCSMIIAREIIIYLSKLVLHKQVLLWLPVVDWAYQNRKYK